MALWNWIRAVIGTKEFHYLIGYLLRALVATESPGIVCTISFIMYIRSCRQNVDSSVIFSRVAL